MSNELPNYKLILAGSLGVGKTTIYDVVKKHWPEGRGEASKWTHCVELDNERVKVSVRTTNRLGVDKCDVCYTDKTSAVNSCRDHI